MSQTATDNALQVPGSWKQLLLLGPVDDSLREGLPSLLSTQARSFLKTFDPFEHGPDNRELNQWYQGPQGQMALRDFTLRAWAQLNEFAQHAMPAHDARHAIRKVPAAAIRYVHSEGVQGWQRVGVLGALLHDHGRWSEERIYGRPREGLMHARMGFVLTQELLSDADMPQPVKDHIAYCVLQHTTGAQEQDPMPVKLTVSADRDQLLGPELVLRLSHHIPMPDGWMGTMLGVGRRSVLDRLEKFLRTRLPGPLYSRQFEVDRLHRILLDFVLMAESESDSLLRWGRVCPYPQHPQARWSQPMPESLDWERQRALAKAAAETHRGPTASQALTELLHSEHVATAETYLSLARYKVEGLSVEQDLQLGAALAWLDAQRQLLDLEELRELVRLSRTEPDSWLRVLSGLITG